MAGGALWTWWWSSRRSDFVTGPANRGFWACGSKRPVSWQALRFKPHSVDFAAGARFANLEAQISRREQRFVNLEVQFTLFHIQTHSGSLSLTLALSHSISLQTRCKNSYVGKLPPRLSNFPLLVASCYVQLAFLKIGM